VNGRRWKRRKEEKKTKSGVRERMHSLKAMGVKMVDQM
jgi:hypothetical protein